MENRNSVMIIGEKETFVIRVLLKKLQEAGVEAFYVHADIAAVNAAWQRASLLTYYMDADDHLPEDLSRFLMDKMRDDEKQILLVGEQTDIRNMVDHFSGDLIYKTFLRPLDNADFTGTVLEFFQKEAQGDFKKRILIVDDDATYLGVVREWLRDTYKVSMATSGLKAIKWLGMNKVDLILLDHEMPVTSGPQVLEMLRSENETKSIPVIFLTGKSDKASVMKVLSLKPEGYLLKTIEKEQLLAQLKEFFEKRK